MSWTAAVDSRIGTRHRADGLPCQDFGRLSRPVPDMVLGAVADGAGSAALSHLGAQAAVTEALGHVGGRLAEEPALRGDPAGAETLFDGLLPAVRRSIDALAETHEAPAGDFATTLLVFAAGPTGVALWQVGDGLLVCRTGEGSYALLAEPVRGEYVNETVFVTDPDAGESRRLGHLHGPMRFLCAATDGLLPVSIEAPENRPHDAFFRPLDSFMAETEDDRDAHMAIRGFLRSDRLAERVSDDVTLMLCGWRAAGRA